MVLNIGIEYLPATVYEKECRRELAEFADELKTKAPKALMLWEAEHLMATLGIKACAKGQVEKIKSMGLPAHVNGNV